MVRTDALSASIILSTLWGLTIASPSPHEFTLTWKRENGKETFNATTTFYIYYCDAQRQIPAIEQAHKDALKLANAAFYDDRELSVGDPHQLIDFTSQAAIDYFGPADFKPSQHQRIYDTLYRATETYPGWGLSDWWNSRYIDVFCDDFANDCVNKETGTKSAAYLSQWDPATKRPRQWPWINYCPPFFDILKSHEDKVKEIDNDKTGRKKLNTKNLRTRATTALHEWMHINNDHSSMICEGGCEDTKQIIGGEWTSTYKSGAAKLLARKSPELAAKTNDNLVYFATARFMEKRWGVYPEFPLAWDNRKTPKQNKEAEKLQPGEPEATSTSDLDALGDGDPNVDGTPVPSVPADAPLLDAKNYPQWYQPVLSATGSSTLPPISQPTRKPIPPAALPKFDAVRCNYMVNRNIQDPTYDDCVQAFAPTFDYTNRTQWMAHPPKPGKGTTAYSGWTSGTCALTVQYGGDWSGCEATNGDIWTHARVVFEGCVDYSTRTVGGSVPLNVKGCPGNVSITHTVEAIEAIG
ncbi:uncharacterized protein GGS22DRAFT_157909 [Annulohypoxylon maeteangense]|uniref:uncharacterized protein n=1 Tax=Annulohypoxylon maeteangense TaxID=1927788 RepID=UPI0020078BB1|nr:uncharacterized protein GGS22DRAFT_157909 [Annulohypoxylon maeteangense]KAI0886464.1 hypothetical protein GGS22DRAFT_157909 [Annulohypoxylon maeteangense]